VSMAPTRIVLDSGSSAVAELPTRLSNLCRLAGLDASAAFELTTAVVEAVNNSIEHAYGGEPGHPIALAVRQADGMLDIEIRDRGRPLPPGTIEAATMPDADALSGRGWAIVKAFTHSIHYAREANENVLTLSRRLNPDVADG
jgi:serine/threonine-protein kinase RsbW